MLERTDISDVCPLHIWQHVAVAVACAVQAISDVEIWALFSISDVSMWVLDRLGTGWKPCVSKNVELSGNGEKKVKNA